MNKIAAFISNPKYLIDKNTIKLILDSGKVDEVIIFSNGGPLHITVPDDVTLMETEVEVGLVNAYRRIISYVNQSRSEGLLYLFRGSDRLRSDSLFDLDSPHLITVNSGGPFKGYPCEVENLFKLDHPLGIVPILSIPDLKFALTSRDFYSYITYFCKLPWIPDESVELFIPELAVQEDEYLIELIKPEAFSDKLTKRVVNYLISRNHDTSSSI